MSVSNKFRNIDVGNNIERENFLEEFNRLTFLDVFRILSKRKISIISTFFLSLGLTILYTYFQEPLYLSRAYIEVSKSFDFIEQQKYLSIAKPEQIKSRKMLERIAKSIKDTNEYSLPPDENDRIEYINKLIYTNYTSGIKNYIEVRTVTNNAYLSRDLANQTAKIFVSNVWDDQRKRTSKVQKYLKERIPTIRNKINLLKLKIEKIDNFGVLKLNLKEFKAKKNMIIQNIEEDKKKLGKYKDKIVGGILFAEESHKYNIAEVNNNITEYENRYYDYIKKGFHEKYIDVQEILKKLVYFYMIKNKIRNSDLGKIAASIEKTDLELQEYKKFSNSYFDEIEDKELYKRRLNSELKTLNTQLGYNIQKFEELATEFEGKEPYIKFYKGAKLAFKPTFPSWSTNTYVGIALGVVFSIIYIIIIENFDPTLDDIKKIKRITHYPILGYIPYSPEIVKMEREEVRFLISKIDVKSLLAEACRVLKINMNFALNRVSNNKTKVVSITSTNKGEGKSTVLLNLAISVSQSGKKTVIIDCNLRRPSLSKHFGIKRDTKGVINYCNNNGDLNIEQVVCKTDITNLDVVVSGGIAKYPAEILESGRFLEIINYLRQKYDMIFLDCPPLGLVIDAAIASKYADGVLLAYSMAEIPKENLLMIIEQLEYGNIKVLGLVLNSLKKATQIGYYRYYHYYKYQRYVTDDKKRNFGKKLLLKKA